MMKFQKIAALSVALCSLTPLASTAALVDMGSGLIYDDVLNVTWLQDASFSMTNGDDSDGRLTWAEANTWVDNLTVGGVSGWRLPTMDVNGNGTVIDCSTASELACRDNELAYMFYQNGINAAAPSPFTNVQSAFYWTSSISETTPILRTWILEFDTGFMLANGQILDTHGTWAVYDGKVSAVPVPAAIWLFGSGLLGLAGMARRKK